MEENPSYFESCGEDGPVENVCWHDCEAFIERLNAEEKTNKYRFPNESEWECACRAEFFLGLRLASNA